MSTQTLEYNPILFSERVAPLPDGSFNLCRAASLAMAYDAATNGDWTTNPDGSRWGRAKIKSALEKMRKSAGPDPGGDGYNQGDQVAFLKGVGAPTDAWEKRNVLWSQLMEDLDNGWVVELAGDVGKTRPDSPLREYVNPVAHDILMVGLNRKTDRITFIDPMTPHGTKKYIRSAPVGDFRDFGSRFRTAANDYIAGRVKRGKYSDVAKARRQGQPDPGPDVSVLEQEIVSLQNDLEQRDTKIAIQENRIQQARDISGELRDVLQ